MYKKIPIALLALTLALPTFAAEWVLLTTADDSKTFVDMDSIRKTDDGTVKMWIKAVYENRRALDSSVPTKYFRSTLSLALINCAAETSMYGQGIWYEGNDGDGAIVMTHDWANEPVNYRSAPPGTLGAAEMRWGCAWKKAQR